MVQALAPATGFVALYGPDEARIVDRVGADGVLAGAGDIWTWGRAFSSERELLWRCEGDRAVVVVARTPADAALVDPMPAGLGAARVLGGCEEWTAIPANERHPRLRLWDAADLRVLPLRLPERFASTDGVALAIEEYEGPDGLAWCRYLDLVKEG
ncbi:MAG: hypothetical protein ACRDY5_07340 [Acidimicrobiales bacterium]